MKTGDTKQREDSLVVLSLFDGMSCGQIALNLGGISDYKYYASEVDKYAIKVTQSNYPNTTQLGDILEWKTWNIDWHKWEITQPDDKGLVLKDILETGVVDRDKSFAIDANYFKGGNLKQYFEKHRRQLVFSKEGLCHVGDANPTRMRKTSNSSR